MAEQQRNYGIEPEPANSGSAVSESGRPSYSVDMSPADENVWSALSHLSVFLNPFTGFLPVAAFLIWIFQRNRSPRVSFHALQSMWYQVAWLAVLTVGWTITGILTLFVVGLLLVPLMLVLTLVPLVDSVYAAYKVNQGIDYRYLAVADMVSGERKAGI